MFLLVQFTDMRRLPLFKINPTKPMRIQITRSKVRVSSSRPDLITLVIYRNIKTRNLSTFHVETNRVSVVRDCRIKRLTYITLYPCLFNHKFTHLTLDCDATHISQLNTDYLEYYQGPAIKKLEKLNENCKVTLFHNYIGCSIDLSHIREIVLTRFTKGHKMIKLKPEKLTMQPLSYIKHVSLDRLVSLNIYCVETFKRNIRKRFDFGQIKELTTNDFKIEDFPNVEKVVINTDNFFDKFFHSEYEPKINRIRSLTCKNSPALMSKITLLGLEEFYSDDIEYMPSAEEIREYEHLEMTTNVRIIRRHQAKYQLKQILPYDHVRVIIDFI